MASDTLLHQTHSLRADFFEKASDLLAQLAREGQKPKVMFIGCADSRVVPELLTGAQPGEVFVVRNVANIIPPFGTGHWSVGAALEYAVNHLQVAHLVVCGHTDCGGIKALDGRVDALADASLSQWIELAREAQTRVDGRGVEKAKRHQAIVEQNIILQLERAAGYPAIRKALKENRLELHGWLFDLHGPLVYSYDPKSGQFEAA
jgi:carbonic anhydrase